MILECENDWIRNNYVGFYCSSRPGMIDNHTYRELKRTFELGGGERQRFDDGLMADPGRGLAAETSGKAKMACFVSTVSENFHRPTPQRAR